MFECRELIRSAGSPRPVAAGRVPGVCSAWALREAAAETELGEEIRAEAQPCEGDPGDMVSLGRDG